MDPANIISLGALGLTAIAAVIAAWQAYEARVARLDAQHASHDAEREATKASDAAVRSAKAAEDAVLQHSRIAAAAERQSEQEGRDRRIAFASTLQDYIGERSFAFVHNRTPTSDTSRRLVVDAPLVNDPRTRRLTRLIRLTWDEFEASQNELPSRPKEILAEASTGVFGRTIDIATEWIDHPDMMDIFAEDEILETAARILSTRSLREVIEGNETSN